MCVYVFDSSKQNFVNVNSVRLERTASKTLDFRSKKSSTEESTWSYLVE